MAFLTGDIASAMAAANTLLSIVGQNTFTPGTIMYLINDITCGIGALGTNTSPTICENPNTNPAGCPA